MVQFNAEDKPVVQSIKSEDEGINLDTSASRYECPGWTRGNRDRILNVNTSDTSEPLEKHFANFYVRKPWTNLVSCLVRMSFYNEVTRKKTLDINEKAQYVISIWKRTPAELHYYKVINQSSRVVWHAIYLRRSYIVYQLLILLFSLNLLDSILIYYFDQGVFFRVLWKRERERERERGCWHLTELIAITDEKYSILSTAGVHQACKTGQSCRS